jgi:hypothetical protein
MEETEKYLKIKSFFELNINPILERINRKNTILTLEKETITNFLMMCDDFGKDESYFSFIPEKSIKKLEQCINPVKTDGHA